MKDIIVIVGPTGVGKTKVSIELAKRLDGEIINADSVSIYKDLNIGSAKATPEEQKEAVHHLIDIKEVEDDYTIYDYQKDSRKLIEDISNRDKRVIMVGGSGLYIKAAVYDYNLKKENKNNLYEDLTNEEIYEKIKKVDKDIDIHVNNRQRLVRYLNRIENGDDLTSTKSKTIYPIKIIGLTIPRDLLYERINLRVDKMINDGLIAEVNNLKDKYKDSKILNNAIGYKEFYDYLFNNKSIDEVKSEIMKNSRHYAKRQYTFFNNQMDVKWFDVDLNDIDKTIDKIINYIN